MLVSFNIRASGLQVGAEIYTWESSNCWYLKDHLLGLWPTPYCAASSS